jgi:hypothetical protein
MLKSINQMIRKRATRKISFPDDDLQQPKKRAKYITDIIQSGNDPLPFLDKK